jgi:hypothetical protein
MDFKPPADRNWSKNYAICYFPGDIDPDFDVPEPNLNVHPLDI